MRRRVIACVLLGLAAPARADFTRLDEEPEEDVDAPDRELGGTLAVAIGGMNTPGGLRLGADYLYQMSETDWFDGGLVLTGAPGEPTCFRDRMDVLICDHGGADGASVDLFAGIRRYAGGQGQFRPWVRPGAAIRLVRYADDDLTGLAVIGQAAAGVRARITDLIAVGGMAAIEAGAGIFNRGLGVELQLGLVIGVTVDFGLR